MHQEKLIHLNICIKVKGYKYLIIFLKIWLYLSLSDFCLAILWIEESRPSAWFSRRGFTRARKSLLLLCLFAGSFLLMGYKSNLRASLTTINYEQKFEMIHDLVQSGIPLAFAKGTITDRILSTDPRPTVQRMYKNVIGYPYAGSSAPKWILDK